jgi:hypothetical protein
MTDWTPEEDEAFNDVEKHSNLGKQILREMGQPYHFDPVFVSVSQRNQVLEEAAKVVDAWSDWHGGTEAIAKAIRGLKK